MKRRILVGFVATFLTGCAAFKHDLKAVDQNYRTRVDHFQLGIGIQYNPPTGFNIGIAPTWYYRDPRQAPTTVPLKSVDVK